MEERKSLPTCIGFIMDGNRRWAKEKSLPTLEGHKKGAETFKEAIGWVRGQGIPHAVFYAFSTENWKRPKIEIDALMSLLVSSIHDETKTLIKNNIRLKTIGNILQLPIPES